jgi:hypothetical protein
MTLHKHRVDSYRTQYDGNRDLPVPEGWQIADGSADDVRVCGAYGWSSQALVFANGHAYGTAAYRDEFHSPAAGKKVDDAQLSRTHFGDEKFWVRASYHQYDVLLRKRA